MRSSVTKTVQALVLTLSALAPSVARGAPQRLPFAFDPSLPAKPSQTAAQIAAAEAVLPPLPSELEPLTSGAVTLWFAPDTAAALMRAGASIGAPTAPWPEAPGVCAAHDAFVIPDASSLLAPGASNVSGCTDAANAVASDLRAALGACREIEEPERYVRRLPAADVSLATTADPAGLVGIAGEALSHAPSAPSGLLPADFAPSVRTILKKVREGALNSVAADGHDAFARARSALVGHASCFPPSTTNVLSTSIDALDAELEATRTALTALVQRGRQAADHEALCLAARGRARQSLVVPSLTQGERRFAAFWLGAIFWRMRGGGLIPLGSTQSARLLFLQRPFTVLGEIAGGPDGADAAMQIYLAVFEGWGTWQDMGHTPGQEDAYDDLVSMTRRGERQVHQAAQLLASRGYDATPLTEGGLSMGPCYFYGYDPLGAFRFADAMSSPYGAFIEGPTAVGEACTGASIAQGLADSLLAGRATGSAPTIDLCANRTCGDDGCGGSCGSCGDGTSCVDGACVSAASAGTSAAPSPPREAGTTELPVAPPSPPSIASTDPAGGCSTAGARAGDGWLAVVALLFLSAGCRPSPRSRRTRRSWRPCPSSPDRTSTGRG